MPVKVFLSLGGLAKIMPFRALYEVCQDGDSPFVSEWQAILTQRDCPHLDTLTVHTCF